MTKIEHLINEKGGRFVLYQAGVEAGEMTYLWEGDECVNFNHTRVDKVFAGQGLAKQLVMRGVEFAREKGVKINPSCWYVRKVLEENAVLHDLLYKG